MKKKTKAETKKCCCCTNPKLTLIILGAVIVLAVVLFFSASSGKKESKTIVEQFGDIKVLKFDVPGFDKLSAQQKEFAYYLYEAALAGRDIYYDQNYKNNLFVRHTLEEIYKNYTGDRNTEDFKKFHDYLKMFWVSSGIHHHQSLTKMIPEFSKDYFADLVHNSPEAKFPIAENETAENLLQKITPILFDPKKDAVMVNQEEGTDLIAGSAVNFYEGLTQKEVEAYYQKITDPNDPTPVSYGLNSKMIKINGTIAEIPWKVGGMYSQAIEKIVTWLDKAATVAESDTQKATLQKLIEYYKTGNLKTFDEFSILWLKDKPQIDFSSSFIETYLDPLGKKGSYQSVTLLKDEEGTKHAQQLAENAQWFEDHLPIADEFKNKKANASFGTVVNQVFGNGDYCGPLGFFGVNLPNSSWIRSQYGAKTNTLANILSLQSQVYIDSGGLDEFAYSDKEVALEKKYSALTSIVETDLHEILGHSSGQARPGVSPENTLQEYFFPIEESRAESIALYYLMDPKLVELGIIPNLDAGKAEYNNYITYGLFRQLSRVAPGQTLTQAHIRARQLISRWSFEKGKDDNVIERKIRDGKTFFVINDYEKLRALFGELIHELQRIVSEGDYAAAKDMVETYATKPDPELHKEAIERWNKLNVAPNSAYLQPLLTPVMKGEKIVDVKLGYPKDFTEQMMMYGEKYSFLPIYN